MQFYDFDYFWENIYKSFISDVVMNIVVRNSEIFDFYLEKNDTEYVNKYYFTREIDEDKNNIGFYNNQMIIINSILDNITGIDDIEKLKTFLIKIDNNNRFENVDNDIYVSMMEMENLINNNVKFFDDIMLPEKLSDSIHQLLQIYDGNVDFYNISYYMNDIQEMLINIPKINSKVNVNLPLLFEFPYVDFLRLQKINKYMGILSDSIDELNGYLNTYSNDIVMICLITTLNMCLMLELYILLDELNFQKKNITLLNDLSYSFFNNSVIDANTYNYFNNIYGIVKTYELSYLDIYIQNMYNVLQKVLTTLENI